MTSTYLQAQYNAYATSYFFLFLNHPEQWERIQRDYEQDNLTSVARLAWEAIIALAED